MSKLGPRDALSGHGNEEEAPPLRYVAANWTSGPTVQAPRQTPAADARPGAERGQQRRLRGRRPVESPRVPPHASRRRQWVIILVTVACVGLSLAYSAVTKPVYQATANLLLTPQLSSTLLQANNSNVVTAVDVPTDIQLVESDPVAQVVREAIPNAPSVSVTEVGTTNVVAVSVQSTNPKLAARAATAYARAYITVQQRQAVDSLSNAAQIVQNNVNSVQNADQQPCRARSALRPSSDD